MCRVTESLVSNKVLERDVLPANVIPRHYQLELESDFDKFTFNGKVVIDLETVEDSSSITLHSQEISIRAGKTTSGGTDQDEQRQTTAISFAGRLNKDDNAQLELTFHGQLNNKMVGFYRSGYTEADGARQAFPCFDEPALKATFDITLIADHHSTSLSNMPMKSETLVQSRTTSTTRKAVKFDTSPTMSTYLTAFIIGELDYVESNLFRIPVRTYVTIDQNVEYGRHAADLGAQTLELFEKEFRTVTIQQNRFLRTGDATPEDDKIVYLLILSLRTEGGIDRSMVMTHRKITLNVPAGSFFKLNADHTSIYRTLYSPEILARLGQAAQEGILGVADKTGLVANAAALTATGYTKTSTFLTLAQSFKDEASFFVWNELLVGLDQISIAWMFQDAAVTEGLKTFRKSSSPQLSASLGTT
ncbi:hypothetical protein MY11210_000275 [Beauveria gryllotalpidicola]